MNSEKLALKKLRQLNFSAASGLVKLDKTFYVIADDELSLSSFELNSREELLVRLKNGQLPTEHAGRKKLKPDWESLCYINSTINKAHGLLAVPSGSKPNRMDGFFIRLDKQKPEAILQVDFTKIYEALLELFSELNIEGSAVTKDRLVLFQRGNGSLKQNALIELDLAGLCSDLFELKSLGPERILKITAVDLGMMNGNPLAFTDACFVMPDLLFFLAVAENTTSTYNDGEYLGAQIGCLNRAGEITFLQWLDCPFKPEGLWVEQAEGKKNIYIVTDADNRNQAACLYFTQIS